MSDSNAFQIARSAKFFPLLMSVRCLHSIEENYYSKNINIIQNDLNFTFQISQLTQTKLEHRMRDRARDKNDQKWVAFFSPSIS